MKFQHLLVVLGIAAGAFFIFMLARPNRLAHDQIIHGTFVKRISSPGSFERDFLFGTNRIQLHSNFFLYDFLAWLTARAGDQEIIYRYGVPFLFIVLTLGMYWLVWYFTRSALASFLGALIANTYVPYFFLSVWGLPGPTAVGPKDIYNLAVPPLFLLFFLGLSRADHRLLALAFFIAGAAGNIHIVSAFNLVLIFALATLFTWGISRRTLATLFLLGILALAGAAPFLVVRSQYLGIDADPFGASFSAGEYRDAIAAAAPHVMLSGRWGVLVKTLWTDGYLVWPFVITFLAGLRIRLRRGAERAYPDLERISLRFIYAVLAVNITISLIQITLLYGFGRAPFYQEPRGMHFLYVVFMLYTGFLVHELITLVTRHVSRRLMMRLVGAGALVLFVTAVAAYPSLMRWYRGYRALPYSFRTCSDGVYEALRSRVRPHDLVLIDPDSFYHLRICTGAGIVVSKRDRGIAYELGDPYLVEWYRRWNTVREAFDHAPDRLDDIAKAYSARFVAARYCQPVTHAKLIYKEPHANLNCIYEL